MPNHITHATAIFSRMIISPIGRTIGFLYRIRLPAISPHLHADMAITLCHIMTHAIYHFVFIAPTGVCISICCLSTLPTQKLIHGHTRAFALDIPQRLIHPRYGIIEHGTIAPVPIDHAHLPNFLNAIHIASHDKRLEMFFNSRTHRVKSLSKRRAPQSVKTGFRRNNFNNNEPRPRRLCYNGFDIFNRYNF